jgi:hypothetical protein
MDLLLENNQSNALTSLVTPSENRFQSPQGNLLQKLSGNLLQPLRQWFDQIEIRDPQMARFISNVIPAQCPFERDIVLFGRKVGHIPPLCKLNPFYEQFVGLRFRALCYLVDECGEDIQPYYS